MTRQVRLELDILIKGCQGDLTFRTVFLPDPAHFAWVSTLLERGVFASFWWRPGEGLLCFSVSMQRVEKAREGIWGVVRSRWNPCRPWSLGQLPQQPCLLCWLCPLTVGSLPLPWPRLLGCWRHTPAALGTGPVNPSQDTLGLPGSLEKPSAVATKWPRS